MRAARHPLGALLVLALAALVVVPQAPPAAAAVSVTLSTSVVPEARTFAAEAYADRWDFSDEQDLSLVDGYRTSGVTGPVYRDGRLDFSVRAGGYLDLASTEAGALPTGRDTALQPLEARAWSRMSVRMWSSVDGTGQVFWFSCPNRVASCQGVTQFALRRGWQYYDIPMVNTTGTPAAWSGRISALRLVPSATVAGSIMLDDLRVYAPTTASHVRVDRAGDSGTAEMLIDVDTVPGNGNETVVGSGLPTSFVFDASRLAPGRWYVAMRSSTGTTYASMPLDVDAAPSPVVLDPDLAGGADYAAVVRGDRWDYAQASDVGPAANLSTLHVDGRVLNGRNGAPNVNDPQVGLPLAGAIDGSRFHRLTMTLEHDGPFGLADAPGGGMLARLIWQVAGGGPNDYQDLEDVVVLPGRHTLTVDLATDPTWAVTDPTTPRRLGWAGHQITSLRIDPNEDPSGRTWRIDDVSIAEDDRGAGSFDIRLTDRTWSPGTVTDVWVDTDRTGFNGTRIATAVPVQQGTTTVRWDAAGFAPGTYWVYVTMSDGRSSSSAYSGGPVRMDPPPVPAPFGSLDSVSTGPGRAVVDGWAIDPSRAGGTSSVHVYADGRPAAVVTATSPRPDVGAAHPAWGSSHGFSVPVELTPGRHAVCAYAVSGSSGGSPSLGCRTVDVPTASPVGSLDSVTRAPGGLRVRGWAVDPSTTDSIQTHTYVGGSFAGSLTAGAARPDVGRALPGYGDAHGVDGLVPAGPPGVRTLCLYGIDTVAPGSNSTLGCTLVDVQVSPFGHLDSAVRSSPSTVELRGWAIDPDTASPAAVHVYVAGRPAAVTSADRPRADVASAHPEYAASGHGWAVAVGVLPGQRACAYAVDVAGAGSSTLLGCRDV